MSKHVSAAGSQPALSRLPLQAAALLAGLALTIPVEADRATLDHME